MDVIFHYSLGGKRDRACHAHAHTEHGNRSTFQTGLWDGVVRTRTCHGVNRFSVLYIVVISQRENAALCSTTFAGVHSVRVCPPTSPSFISPAVF